MASSIEVAKLLIKKGADVDHQDEDSRSSLSNAAVDNRLEWVNLLLDNGADIEIENKVSYSVACLEVCKILVLIT